FRIPSLLVTRTGTILAFCEGRRNGQGDAGEIQIVMRRSSDGGVTWGPLQVIAADGTNTIGNPCPVQDRVTGTIWLLLCRNAEDGHEKDILAGKATREVLRIFSEDDGLSWSPLIDMTADVKQPDWTWYATGPCHGIQLASGRLAIPCNHAVLIPGEEKSGPYISHIIYSDDHGATWRLGNDVGEYTNECSIAELDAGRLYINMRSYHGRKRRAYSWSSDGGLTWTSPELDEALVDPVCQGSVLRLADGRMLFSNCASEKRERLTIKSSRDGCRSWEELAVLHNGPAAYSDLAESSDGTVLCLYECGENRPYETIVLARLTV
ncbi:MAG: BNR/Asp-box repeat protein, partial [Paenibacillaceae bacterium]|nr:BNR/Asp-box repeat protein [Paenibacillaceae bacterium]